MNKSESIKELSAALVKAQTALEGVTKDKNNPFFKSKYADLSSVVGALKGPLTEAGLGYTQVLHDADAAAKVETVIIHSSGEWLSCGIISVPVSKLDAQGYGSALTYARRYSLSAAFGVAPEDDDGNAAAKAAPTESGRKNGNLRPAKNVLGKKPYSIKDGITIDPDRMEGIEETIRRTLNFCFEKRFADALLEMDNNAQGNEEKLFMWDFLSSEERSAITKEAEAQKAKYMKQNTGSQA
jgi:hypothetical protein